MKRFMPLFLATLLLLSQNIMPSGLAAPLPDNKDLFGRWKIVRLLDGADIVGMSEPEAQALVGDVMLLDAMSLRLHGMRCRSPSWQRSVQNSAQFIREHWRARVGKLGLPDSVTVVDAKCTDLLLKNPSVIVFNWDGFFYEADRVK